MGEVVLLSMRENCHLPAAYAGIWRSENDNSQWKDIKEDLCTVEVKLYTGKVAQLVICRFVHKREIIKRQFKGDADDLNDMNSGNKKLVVNWERKKSWFEQQYIYILFPALESYETSKHALEKTTWMLLGLVMFFREMFTSVYWIQAYVMTQERPDPKH